MDDENLPRRKITHDIGQDLSMLSIEELAERIELMRNEIIRLEAASRAKQASRSAADMFFKK